MVKGEEWTSFFINRQIYMKFSLYSWHIHVLIEICIYNFLFCCVCYMNWCIAWQQGGEEYTGRTGDDGRLGPTDGFARARIQLFAIVSYSIFYLILRSLTFRQIMILKLTLDFILFSGKWKYYYSTMTNEEDNDNAVSIQ